MRYPVVIHKDPDSDYSVTFPDLPGCFTAGETIEEALAMAVEAAELHIEGCVEEGIAVADPSPIAALRDAYAGGTWALVHRSGVTLDPLSPTLPREGGGSRKSAV